MSKEPVVKWCNTCSRTYQCVWPKEEVCESWAPDIYAEAAIREGAELIDLVSIEQETADEGC